MDTPMNPITMKARILARRDTTANWNLKKDFVPMVGEICIYTDHAKIMEGEEEKIVPGYKIGDGSAYLIDLPFVEDYTLSKIEEHRRNTDVHVTPEEKAYWNSKVNTYYGEEELILFR